MDTNTNTRADGFSSVWRDEIKRLRPSACVPERDLDECADQAQLFGLALSGGGIRSATFCLGVIQALARLRLLRAFDYLSTVSGGGYIGAWLSTLIYRTRQHQPHRTAPEALAALELALSGEGRTWCKDGTTASNCPPEHPSVRFLRRYSNYLTPKLGIFSGDSLAAASTYLRNLLLNQLLLVAFFGALLTLPYLMLAASRRLIDGNGFGALSQPLGDTGLPLMYGLAIGPALVAVAGCALSLMRFQKGDRFNSTGPGFVVGMIVVPSLVAAWLLALALQAHAGALDYTRWQWVKWTTLLYLMPWVVVFWLKSGAGTFTLVALQKVAAVWAARGDAARMGEALDDLVDWMSGLVRFFWQIPWTLLAGALGGLIFHGLKQGAESLPPRGGLEYAVTFGTPLVLLSFSLVVTVHVGMMKRLYSEQDREWWARLGGFILLAAVAWLSVFAITLYAGPLVKWLAGWAMAGGLAWAATTIGGVLLGKSSLTGGQGPSGQGKGWLNQAVVAAPYVFIIGLSIVLASVLQTLLTYPNDRLCGTCIPILAGDRFGPIMSSALFNLARVEVADVLWVGGACAAVFGLLGWRVDVNLFSLHGFYRNRLTRCYLGATRVGKTERMRIERTPHAFTGFDPEDDLPLSSLADQRPYPIVNAAMNLTGGEDLAWQTRRAASFAFTPCHTGFEFWTSEGERVGAYRCTEEYAANQFVFSNPPGGILLGTVTATSGAAANPNMGYHTSAAVSALLSVFNVRLGRWCGNPCHATAWRKASPRFGGTPLLNEVFGRLSSGTPFLNISDGGHFENLGIYELVRRRCHVVVAVDAACDPDYQFEDLANAIRKCWTDFGTRIQIDLASLRPRGTPRRCTSHFAVGCIRYANAPEPGILIYIKASLSGDESSDVKEYADRHDKFPNESTGDQFFDENQFESYRELGRHIGLKVFAPLFSPQIKTSALNMTPEQIRDALPEQLREHPALRALRGLEPLPQDEAAAEKAIMSWISGALPEDEDAAAKA